MASNSSLAPLSSPDSSRSQTPTWTSAISQAELDGWVATGAKRGSSVPWLPQTCPRRRRGLDHDGLARVLERGADPGGDVHRRERTRGAADGGFVGPLGFIHGRTD